MQGICLEDTLRNFQTSTFLVPLPAKKERKRRQQFLDMCLMAYEGLLLTKCTCVVLAIQQQKYWKTLTQVILVLVTIFRWGLGAEDKTKSLNVFSAHQSLFCGIPPSDIGKHLCAFFQKPFCSYFYTLMLWCFCFVAFKTLRKYSR